MMAMSWSNSSGHRGIKAGVIRSVLGIAGWPVDHRMANLPTVPVWVVDSAESPPVLIAHRVDQCRSLGHGPRHNRFGILNDQQPPRRPPADRLRAEVAMGRRLVLDP